MLGPFTLQLKETNGQQKAQGEIYSKDALTCHLGLQTLLAYLSFFETTNLLVRCYSNVTEQRGILQLGKQYHWQSSVKEVILQHTTASCAMGGVDTLYVSVPGYQCWIWEQGGVVAYGWLKDIPMLTAWLTRVGEGTSLVTRKASYSFSCHCDPFILEV